MTSDREYFYDLGIIPKFTGLLYEELSRAISIDSFYRSSHGQSRSDFADSQLKQAIIDSMPFEISDMGIFRNAPRSRYPLHIDAERNLSLNILLCEPDEKFVVDIYRTNDGVFQKKPIPYRKDIPLLLNTKKYHSITNLHLIKTRYICSIGSTKNSYEEVLNSFQQNIEKLIN